MTKKTKEKTVCFSACLSVAHYQADACVVWCFDDRFREALEYFIENNGIEHYDLVKVAGGAKSLASPKKQSEREFLEGQILASIRLHSARKIVLMVHSDCGAYDRCVYPGTMEEMDKLRGELLTAGRAVKTMLARMLLAVPVEGVLVDFFSYKQFQL